MSVKIFTNQPEEREEQRASAEDMERGTVGVSQQGELVLRLWGGAVVFHNGVPAIFEMEELKHITVTPLPPEKYPVTITITNPNTEG